MNTRQIDIFNYKRRSTVEVNIGGVTVSGKHPIKVQSMTNTSTMDTEGSVEQVLRIVAKGGDIVRKATENIFLAFIQKELSAPIGTPSSLFFSLGRSLSLLF